MLRQIARPVQGGCRICPGAIAFDVFLRKAISSPERTIVALDVDGTISSIAPSPAEAVVDASMRTTLRSLSERYRLWFISGRDASQVRDMVGISTAGYVGAHGLEVLDRHDQDPRPLVSVINLESELEKLVRAVTSELPAIKSHVEAKRWSVAFHYRGIPEYSLSPDRLRRGIEGHLPPALRIRPGKMVFEVVLAVEHDKGSALDWLISTVAPDRVFAGGDDHTDIAMFRALAEQRSHTGIDALSVAVLQGAETPSAVVSAADMTVDGVPGMHQLLMALLPDH